MAKWKDIKKELLKDPEVKKAYDECEVNMAKYYTWPTIQKALNKVLSAKTSPDVIQAILEDLSDELNKRGSRERKVHLPL